jgi:hypothetical protein
MKTAVAGLAFAAIVAGIAGLAGCARDGTAPGPVGSGPPPVPPPEYCAQAPHDRLCSFLPHDVTPALKDGYDGLTPQDQRPFDNFSWQSFLALNWPAGADGKPLPVPIGQYPAAPRVWMSYPRPVDVFHLNIPGGLQAQPDACAGVGDRPGLPVFQLMAKSDHVDPELDSFLQATHQPLIDRNVNFTLFDVRLNAVEASYIESQGLNTLGGQVQFKQAGKTVSFPLGYYQNDTTRTGGSAGAIEIKTAWRLLYPGKGDKPELFYSTPGLVYVRAADSETGRAFCFQGLLGLVGFHLIQRTTGPGGQEQDWMWSTFEHVRNQPEALNAADPTSAKPGPTDCVAPPRAPDIYSYYQTLCSGPGCKPNTAPTPEPNGRYLWASTPPYARRYANGGKYGTQVVRCWKIYPETAELNRAFQQKLAGTVWANYRLINTQWQSHKDSPEVIGQVPRFLSNPVQETYIQPHASCLQCHGGAKTAVGQDANFSFLLRIPRLFAAE